MRKKTILLLAALAVSVASSPALAQGAPKSNQFWWPEQLDLSPLRQQGTESDPMGEGFNYAEAFKALDIDAVKTDIEALMTSSQDWWPRAVLHSYGLAQCGHLPRG
jgi:catalase-peroxidase